MTSQKTCTTCQHYRSEYLAGKCAKGRGGLFRTHVMCGVAKCETWQKKGKQAGAAHGK